MAAAVIDLVAEPLTDRLPLSFQLDAAHEAQRPPETDGRRRDDVRLLVSAGHDEPIHTRFPSLLEQLRPGDLVVVNTSATVGAAIDVVIDGIGPAVIHVSTLLPGDLWLMEPRRRVANGSTLPLALPGGPMLARLPGDRSRPALHLLHPTPGSSRLWLAVAAEGVDVATILGASGRPIRYRYVP